MLKPTSWTRWRVAALAALWLSYGVSAVGLVQLALATAGRMKKPRHATTDPVAGRRFHVAARFPSIEHARAIYRWVEDILIGPGTPPDLAGYCFATDDGAYVAVIADDPPPWTADQRIGVTVLLRRGQAVVLDDGLLDTLFRDWQRKRGSGLPFVEHGTFSWHTYQPRGTDR